MSCNSTMPNSRDRTGQFSAELKIMGFLLAASVLTSSILVFAFLENDWMGRGTNMHGYMISPAVMLVCGKGFVLPQPALSDAPALRSFLWQERMTLRRDEVPSDIRVVEPVDWSLQHRYLIYAMALLWYVFGISWYVVKAYLVGIYAVSILLGYGIFRLGMRRGMSAACAVVFMLSPIMIWALPWVRDFSKAPFMLACMLILGFLVKRAVATRTFLACAALLGAIAGVGLGFRHDLVICLVPSAVVLMCCRRPRAGLALAQRLVAVALLFAVYYAISLPVERAYRNLGQPAHDCTMGLATLCDNTLGIQPASYERVSLFSDPFVEDTFECEYRHNMDGVVPTNTEVRGRRYLLSILRTFPADMMARGYSAILSILGDKSAVFNLIAGRRIMALCAVAVFLMLCRKSIHIALLTLFLALYFCGYTCLQFQTRHVFHLSFVPIWIVGFLADSWLLRRKGASRRDDPACGPAHWFRAGAFAGGVLLVLLLPYCAAKAVQWRAVTRLAEQYATAEMSAVETKPFAYQGWTLFRASGPSAGYLPIPASCALHPLDSFWCVELSAGVESMQLCVWYEKSATAQDYSHVVRIVTKGSGKDGGVKYFFPVYESASSTEWTKFAGIALPSQHAGAFKKLYRIDKAEKYPLCLNLALPEDRGCFEWRQRIGFGQVITPSDPSELPAELMGGKTRSQEASRLRAGGSLDDLSIQRLCPEPTSDPANTALLFELVSAREARGDVDGAVDVCRQALELSPALPATHARLDALLQRKNDPDIRIAAWQVISRNHPDFYAPKYYLGLAFESKQDYASALESYREAASLNAGDPRIRLAIASALLGNGDARGAVAACEDAAAHAIQSREIYAEISSLLARVPDDDLRLEALRRLQNEHPTAPDPCLMLAAELQRKGDNDGAARLSQQGLLLDPYYGGVREMLISSLCSLGRYDEAWRVVKETRKYRIGMNAKVLEELARASGRTE